jgi:phosphopantetheinyl transferase (holo-ACP synthase)
MTDIDHGHEGRQVERRQKANYGKPFMMLTGRAEEAFKDFGGSRLVCSLSHERDNALAVVIIEGGAT